MGDDTVDCTIGVHFAAIGQDQKRVGAACFYIRESRKLLPAVFIKVTPPLVRLRKRVLKLKFNSDAVPRLIQLDLHIKDNRIMKVTGAPDAMPNQGRLCIKGRFGYDFVNSPERLSHPMIRENGELKKASWEAALDRVAAKIQETKKRKGPDAIAGICSGKSTNEAMYLMQKLFRAAIGTNNLSSPYAASGLNHPLVELEQARKDGNLDRSSRLSKIMSVIEEAAKPPAELELVEELMQYIDDENAMNQALQEHADEITPELTQVLTSLIAQGQSVVDETQGQKQGEQQQALESIQKVYEAVLRFSMRRTFMN